MEVFFKAYNNFDIGKYKTKIIILYFATINKFTFRNFFFEFNNSYSRCNFRFTDVQ